MKDTFAALVTGVFTAALAVSGCAASPTQGAPTVAPAVDSTPVSTVDPDPSLEVVSPPADVTPEPKRNIVDTVVSAPAWGVQFTSLNEGAKAADTDSIVAGKVIAIHDFCIQGSGHRRLTIAVQDSAKAKVPSTISVMELGGIVPTSCLKEVLDGKFGVPYVPKEGEYFDFQVEGQKHTPLGAEVLAFVHTAPHNEFGVTHTVATGPGGFFVRSGDQYIRGLVPSSSSTVRSSQTEASLPVAGAIERFKAVVSQ